VHKIAYQRIAKLQTSKTTVRGGDPTGFLAVLAWQVDAKTERMWVIGFVTPLRLGALTINTKHNNSTH
jgi:hypothetical protein